MLHYIIMIRILILKTGNIKKLSLMLMLLDGIYRRHHSVSFSNIKEDQVKRNNWTFFCQNCHNLRILSDKLEKIGDLARFEKFHVWGVLDLRRHWFSMWYSFSFSSSLPWFYSKQSIFLIASWVESLDLAANFVGTVKLFIRFNAFRSFLFFWLPTLLDPQTSLGANMLLDSLVICKRTISRCLICYKIFLLFPHLFLSL